MVSRLIRPLAVLVLVVPVIHVGLSARARAADGEPGIAVLGIEAMDDHDNGLANDITEALRQRITATKGSGALLPGKDLMEIKMVFSCPDEAPPCLAQAGKSLGAGELLFGNVKRSGSDLVITLKLLDANHGVLEATLTDTIPKRKVDPPGLRALSALWLAKLTGKGGGSSASTAATLIIRANVVGATVTLDGAEAGVTTKKGLTINDVSPGKHEITAEKAGYGRISQQFTVGASQALPLTMALQADAVIDGERDGAANRAPPGRDEAPADDSLRGWVRTSVWIALGLSAVSLAVATKYGLDVRQVNRDLDGYRFLKTRNAVDEQFVSDKLAEGNRAETRQWIFVGVGSAFAVAGGFLFYKGYLDKETGGGPRSADNHGLRVFPTASSSSGGVAAEFDF